MTAPVRLAEVLDSWAYAEALDLAAPQIRTRARVVRRMLLEESAKLDRLRARALKARSIAARAQLVLIRTSEELEAQADYLSGLVVVALECLQEERELGVLEPREPTGGTA